MVPGRLKADVLVTECFHAARLQGDFNTITDQRIIDVEEAISFRPAG